MPEISTQTDYRDIVEGTRSYFNLLLTFSSFAQNSITCVGCNRRVKISYFNLHKKQCKLCRDYHYLNCK